MPRRHAARKEAFDVFQHAIQRALKLLVVRRKLHRRVHDETALAMRVIHREPNDLVEEHDDGIARRRLMFQPLHALAKAAFDITLERAFIERTLVAERVVKARRREAHRGSEIAHGRCLVAARPELDGGRLEHGIFVELTRTCHAPSLFTQTSDSWTGTARASSRRR
jgi:hypothetical protein